MRVLVQYSLDRDVVGIANALAQKSHEVLLWNPDEHDIKEFEFDVAIFCDYRRLGFTVKKAAQKKPVLYLKTQHFEGLAGSVIETLPACADNIRFPPTYYNKDFHNDVFVYSHQELSEENIELLKTIPDSLCLKLVGVKVDLVNYIGNSSNPQFISQLARSSKVCIDFGLNCAYDLAKIGANVITDTENQVGLPVFNTETFLDVLESAIKKTQPVLNPYDQLIMPYSQFLQYLGDILGVEF